MSSRSPEREQFLRDVLIGVVEDFGYAGWRQVVQGSYKLDPPHASSVTIIDYEDDNRKRTITLHTISRGVAKVMSGDFVVNPQIYEAISAGSLTNDAGRIDAEAADVVLQAALFGEIVYG